MQQAMKFGGGRFSPPQGLFPSSEAEFGFGTYPPQGIIVPSFHVPFSDLGSGIVDLTEIRTSATATYTGATTKWTRLASGLWASVASGSPRSYYDSSLIYRGFFCEKGTTNRCLWSRDLTNGVWVSGGGAVATAKTQVGLDGAANSCSLMTASGADGTLLQSVINGSATRTFSAWVKRSVGAGTLEMTVDGSTWTDVTSQVGAIGGVLQHCQITQAAVTNPVMGFRIHTSGDAFIVDMCQEETQPYATSPYPATTVAVTRNDDFLTYPIGNISNIEGSAYAEFSPFRAAIDASQGRFLVSHTGGVTAGRVLIIGGGSNQIAINDGTTTVSSSAVDFTKLIKTASAWGGTTMEVTAQGLASVNGVFDGNLGAATAIHIGGNQSGGGREARGALRNVKIFNRKLSSSQLQAMTS